MKITTTVTLRTGEPGAYEFVSAGASINLPNNEAQALVERGFAFLDPSSKQSDIHEAIVDAIGDLQPTDFGKDGKPAVKAIEDIIGQSISASDRDKAWDEYQTLTNDG